MNCSSFIPLSAVAEVNPTSPERFSIPDATIDFLPMSDVGEDGRITPRQSKLVSEIGPGFTNFQNGDILVAKITPCFENGKIALVRGLAHGVGAGSTEFHVIRPGRGIEPRFLAHALRAASFRFHGARRMRGAAGQRRVPSEFIRTWLIPECPLAEQQRIADLLDQADALRHKQETANQLADEYMQSVFCEMFGSPRHNRNGFPLGKIRDYVVSANYGTAKKCGTSGAYPVLRMGNITSTGGWDLADLKYTDLEGDDVKRFTVVAGDLLFNRTNSKDLVGKTAVFREITPMAYAGYLIRVRFNKEADAEYISGFLNSPHGKSVLNHMCKNIVGMANINAQEMQNIEILKPPPDLQRRYGDLVRRIVRIKEQQALAVNHADKVCGSLSQQFFGR